MRILTWNIQGISGLPQKRLDGILERIDQRWRVSAAPEGGPAPSLVRLDPGQKQATDREFDVLERRDASERSFVEITGE